MFPSKTHPERLADGIVHAVSLIGFVVAGGFLLHAAFTLEHGALHIAVLIYMAAVLFSIGMSFAYHLLPRHDLRPLLRKWDHAAIYPVIAATFSPLLIIVGTWSAHLILAAVWGFAIIGVGFKLLGSNLDSRWSLVSYLGLGWFALLALPDFWMGLPRFSTYAVAGGGIFYTIGTAFYRRKEMRYRYPIWHTFGTLGGFSFFAGIYAAVIASTA